MKLKFWNKAAFKVCWDREHDRIHVSLLVLKSTGYNTKSRICLSRKRCPNSSPKERRLGHTKPNKRVIKSKFPSLKTSLF